MDSRASTAEAVVVILAAGLGSRMGGGDKPNLPWANGRTLLEHQVDTVRTLGFDCVAVTRSQRDDFFSVVNPFPERGLAESLKIGLDAVRRWWGSRASVGVLLADQPFVLGKDIEAVYQGFLGRPSEVHAIRARYGGVPGHPVFFDSAWDAVVIQLQGDTGLGRLWRSRADVQWVDVAVSGRPAPSFDIDTEAAYRQALNWAH